MTSTATSASLRWVRWLLMRSRSTAPDPQIYRHALAQLGAGADTSVAVEDAVAGFDLRPAPASPPLGYRNSSVMTSDAHAGSDGDWLIFAARTRPPRPATGGPTLR